MTDDSPPWIDEAGEVPRKVWDELATPLTVQLQYVEVRFSSRDRRTYHYHNDGPRVAVGDEVRIPGRHPDDGWKAVEVVGVSDEKPPFATKPILQELPDNASHTD